MIKVKTMLFYEKNCRLTPRGLEFAAWIWIGCSLATFAMSQQNFYAHGRYGKRFEQKPLFLSGSRYGRSGQQTAVNIKNAPKLVEVQPRVDRFFLGSRYGKRTPVDSPKHYGFTFNYLSRFQRAMHPIDLLNVATDNNQDNQQRQDKFKYLKLPEKFVISDSEK